MHLEISKILTILLLRVPLSLMKRLVKSVKGVIDIACRGEKLIVIGSVKKSSSFQVGGTGGLKADPEHHRTQSAVTL